MLITSVWIGFLMLGITIVSHIFLVSLVLGLAFMAPILEYLSYRWKDEKFEALAKSALKYLAISELAAGVWATWFTVALAGFWPQLTFIATAVLFYPLTIAITGVMIGIPFMAIYWYTWGAVSRRTHMLIGVVMAAGALLVPTGFNMIFSFLDDPVGLKRALAGNGWAVFQNPLYPDFTIHRISAAISMAAMAFSAVYAIKAHGDHDRIQERASEVGLYIGLPALLVASITGVIYAFLLDKYSPYVASAVLGPLSFSSVVTYFRLYPAFVGFMVIISGIWVSAMFNGLHKAFDRPKEISSFILLIFSLVGVPYGEVLNDLPRYPYMVIQGVSGIPATNFINHWMYISPVFAYAAMIVGTALMVVFSYMIYTVLASKTAGKSVEGISSASTVA